MFSKSSVEIGSLQRPPDMPSLCSMNLLATCKIAFVAGYCFAPLARANELGTTQNPPIDLKELEVIGHADGLEAVEGPNVRKMRHEDGSNSVFIRSTDQKTLTKKTHSPNGPLTMTTIYRMDASGNPRGCKISDGQSQEMFKVSYGYHKVTGKLVEELMFDSRVKRLNKDTGKEQPVQRIAYLYDVEGKRSAPIVFNYLPGKTFQQVFGLKSSALETNPFNEVAPPQGKR